MRARRLRIGARITYGLALVMLAGILGAYVMDHKEIAQHIWIPGLLLALTGSIVQWRELWHYDEDIGRYRMILEMYQRAEYELAYYLETAQEAEASRVVCELARQALNENYKWYATHSVRELGH